jgi:Mn-dependent DtxR family transcriptional regulator
MLNKFLVEHLGVSEEVASVEACGIEHLISDETAQKLEKLMERLENK